MPFGIPPTPLERRGISLQLQKGDIYIYICVCVCMYVCVCWFKQVCFLELGRAWPPIGEAWRLAHVDLREACRLVHVDLREACRFARCSASARAAAAHVDLRQRRNLPQLPSLQACNLRRLLQRYGRRRPGEQRRAHLAAPRVVRLDQQEHRHGIG